MTEQQQGSQQQDENPGIARPLPDDQQTLDAQETLKRRRAKEAGTVESQSDDTTEQSADQSSAQNPDQGEE